ncbi:hypothetical protein UUU_12830 [Klebsiella pneumoniae subsp. pneumoniae DSM 30104 = JCM 1662 = NBRC 14940]|nr:hypothetical protein UUU_12830 [Klebsiella pneumoniae subsp. pneumoniae DSM 30104 = JCM 1662 = NBRC 14940]
MNLYAIKMIKFFYLHKKRRTGVRLVRLAVCFLCNMLRC